MEPERRKDLEETALKVRKDIVRMIGVAKGGHLLSSLSLVELLVFLYWETMNIRPDDPLWPERDRLVLSKGHGCPALYAVLANRGYFDREELWNYRRLGSMLQGHPEYPRTPGIDAPSGSLGMGLGIAGGIALALRSEGKESRVFAVLGDGELQEGSVWESVMTASHWKLDQLVAIVDVNRVQMEGFVDDIKKLEPLAGKFEAFGWNVALCDGHDMGSIEKALIDSLSGTGHPSVVLAATKPGKGVTAAERGELGPVEPLDRIAMDEALRELEGRSETETEATEGGEPYEKYP
jgi:transketolase